MSGARQHRFSAWTNPGVPLDPMLSDLVKQRSSMIGATHAALPVLRPAAAPTAGDAGGAGPAAAAPTAKASGAHGRKLHLTRAVLRTMSDAGDSAYMGSSSSEAPDSPHPPQSTASGPPAQAGSGAPSESGQSSVCLPEAVAVHSEAEAGPDSPRSSCTSQLASHPLPELRGGEVRTAGREGL